MSIRDVLGVLCEILDKEQIGYAIIGGYAVAAWGQVRATQDIDILCNVEDIARLKEALDRSAMTFEHRRGDRDDPIQHVIRIQAPSNEAIDEIDVIAGIADSPKGLLSRSRPIQIDHMTVRVAGPEDLIILKLLAGSALDLQDARSILRSKHHHIDFPLLHALCPPKIAQVLETLIAASEGD